jgi:predicted MPP superfamily phosphohydrolase
MRLVEVENKENHAYLLPIGDLHCGSSQSDLEKFEGYLKWAREEKSYIFLMGDLYDVVTKDGVSDLFDCSMNLQDAKHYLRDRLKPVRELIIGAIIGNHEQRLMRYAHCDLIEDLCDDLEVPYCRFSAVVRMRLGHTPRKVGGKEWDSTRVNYAGYFHHTTGGGATVGGKLNRVAKLSELVEGMDFLVGAHNHLEAGAPIDRYRLHTESNGTAILKADKVFLVDSGSFLRWDGSYAEEKQLPPSHTGCPRIRLDGVRKDVHVSQ